MSEDIKKTFPKEKDSINMGAKIANQINTNQQSNMCLSAYSTITQNSSTVNINFG